MAKTVIASKSKPSKKPVRRQGIDRSFFRGQKALCPDCNCNTFIRVGSLLTADLKPEVLDPRIVDRIVNDAIDFDTCSECDLPFRTRAKETFVAWLDIGDNLLCGPLCRCCFDKHLRDKLGDAIVSDIKVYHINIHSNSTTEALEYIQAMSPRRRIFESLRYEAPNSRHLRLTELV